MRTWRRPPRTTSLSSLLRRPGLGLSLELVEGLLGGVGYHRVLPVQLLLGHVVHHLPHAGLTTQTDTTEPLTLPIGSVLVELDLYEVGHGQVLHTVLDVLVSGPPGEVSNIELPPPALSPWAQPSGRGGGGLHVILLLGSHSQHGGSAGSLVIFLGSARSNNVIVQVIVVS